jgi:hypothetical protein
LKRVFNPVKSEASNLANACGQTTHSAANLASGVAGACGQALSKQASDVVEACRTSTCEVTHAVSKAMGVNVDAQADSAKPREQFMPSWSQWTTVAKQSDIKNIRLEATEWIGKGELLAARSAPTQR